MVMDMNNIQAVLYFTEFCFSQESSLYVCLPFKNLRRVNICIFRACVLLSNTFPWHNKVLMTACHLQQGILDILYGKTL